jgi:hypothetical protein
VLSSDSVSIGAGGTHELTTQHELFVTQGHHGIDAHGAPHRDLERRQAAYVPGGARCVLIRS